MKKETIKANWIKALIGSIGSAVLTLGVVGGLGLVIRHIGAPMFLTALLIMSGAIFAYLFLRDKDDLLGQLEDKINKE